MAGVDRERGLKLGERSYVKRVGEHSLNDPLLTSSAKNPPLSSLAFVNVLAFSPSVFRWLRSLPTATSSGRGKARCVLVLGQEGYPKKRASWDPSPQAVLRCLRSKP
jgi:hypothetical protein